jgi:hypothetical protein
MANPQEMDQVARIAAKQLGAEAPAPQAPAPAPKPQEAPTTVQEKAAEAGSPKTEGDKSSQDPVVYKVKIGDNERDLTPQQIAGTFERYRDLNYKQAQMKPVMELAEKMMQAGNATPEQVAKFMGAAAQAMTKNAKMGRAQNPQPAGTAAPQQPQNGNANISERMAAEFKKYEDDNAISLPPGYREGLDELQRMRGMLQQQTAQMAQVLQASKQNAQTGVNAAQQAGQDRAGMVRQAISNNLDSAQQANGLPDTDAKLFMAFAGERGYTAEDFADKGLTNKVMQDFKNAKNGPELARLQEMQQRRQAFMQAPNRGPAVGQSANVKDDSMARLSARAMGQAMQQGRLNRK